VLLHPSLVASHRAWTMDTRVASTQRKSRQLRPLVSCCFLYIS
jgi:hypothetical protein